MVEVIRGSRMCGKCLPSSFRYFSCGKNDGFGAKVAFSPGFGGAYFSLSLIRERMSFLGGGGGGGGGGSSFSSI